MGSLCNESYEEFLDSLKSAGIAISNEESLRERLAETQRWRYAFMSMARNGSAIGIRFVSRESRPDDSAIRSAFARHAFPDSAEAVFAASLASN